MTRGSQTVTAIVSRTAQHDDSGVRRASDRDDLRNGRPALSINCSDVIPAASARRSASADCATVRISASFSAARCAKHRATERRHPKSCSASCRTQSAQDPWADRCCRIPRAGWPRPALQPSCDGKNRNPARLRYFGSTAVMKYVPSLPSTSKPAALRACAI